MSDHPHGPEWWQASDGRWYPPQEGQQRSPYSDWQFTPPREKSKAPKILVLVGIPVVLIVAAIATAVMSRDYVRESTTPNLAEVDGRSIAGKDSAGKRDNPLQMGVGIDLANGWTVRVDSADLGGDVAAAVADARPSNPPAEDGSRYIVVRITATYLAPVEGVGVTQAPSLGFRTSVVGSEDEEYTELDVLATPPPPAFEPLAEVPSGGSITGNVLFEVGADEVDFVLRIEALIDFDGTEGWVQLDD